MAYVIELIAKLYHSQTNEYDFIANVIYVFVFDVNCFILSILLQLSCLGCYRFF